ncbi:MAG: hypothetical protein COV36_00950 [Alphaproteobacteria bacterium CG11_big_fil_rev_8_21_14_0_20_44_7]|nr:MAG: hypothetical protein COV36_00950 [Alphaproteobacteria bacterium CG11_big_fil_rev_8_21_14_0_20_44_7]
MVFRAPNTDKNRGSTIVQKLLTYSLILFILYIYFTDYRTEKQQAAELANKAETVKETSKSILIKNLVNDTATSAPLDIDNKAIITLTKEDLAELNKKEIPAEGLELFEIGISDVE